MTRFAAARPLLSAAALAVGACAGDALGPASSEVMSVIITPAAATVAIGADVSLAAQVLGEAGVAIPDRPVHWTSADRDVATVAEDGTVTAHRLGTVQVAASAGGRSGIAEITVTATPVASVHVTPGNRALFVGESFQFVAEARDGDGNVLSGRPISWSSNNEDVATVSKTGGVTALAPGGAIITASSEGKTALASVTVAAVPVASVRVTPDTQPLLVGQSAQLRAEPLDASGQPLPGRVVLWGTSHPAIATVTSTGAVTAHAPGKATITAMSEGRSDAATILVSTRPPNAVVVSPAQSVVVEGGTVQLSAQVLDDNGQPLPGGPIGYVTSDGAVATVSSGGLVTGVAPGKVTITASSGGRTGTANVTVLATPVARVVVTPSTAFILVGSTVTLSAEARSETGQALPGRSVTWTSGAPGIAAVSSSGVVTGLSPGTAVIFATIDGVLGWAIVTVGPVPASTLTVSPGTVTLGLLDSASLDAVVRDAPGARVDAAPVSWSTSNALVASVTQEGTVTGLLPGTVTITATAGSLSGTASVTVRLGG